jgi:hypothetical protein
VLVGRHPVALGHEVAEEVEDELFHGVTALPRRPQGTTRTR